ncbi:MAG: prepilin peptidase [Gammaproteobacteria bacterium]|nr:prepilin peptidase [Gammaproteobacteria bacterium]
MVIIEFLRASPATFIAVTGVVGLMVGSFLIVVIYRLPLMLEREWRAQCAELLGQSAEPAGQKPFNLVVPRSHCPQCGHAVRALENIPVLSYLALRGRCSACGARIPLRYPAVELLTGLLSAVVAWRFGYGMQAAGALLLTWALIPLSVIDIDRQLLPDAITLPFVWVGLTLSLPGLFTDPRSSIIGALAGYLFLWALFKLFKRLTGRDGMGYGDFKLLALLGAWLGWQTLPVILFLASLVGAAVGVALIVFRGRDRRLPIPFGPYLAAAGWIALLWGGDLTRAYLTWARLA